jgi:hypothetical protein
MAETESFGGGLITGDGDIALEAGKGEEVMGRHGSDRRPTRVPNGSRNLPIISNELTARVSYPVWKLN